MRQNPKVKLRSIGGRGKWITMLSTVSQKQEESMDALAGLTGAQGPPARRQKIRLVRADSGFFDDAPLSFLQQRSLAYIIVARMTL